MATLAEKLAQAKAIYNKNVSNQESSTIINRSKAAVDAAQKAYDASGSRGATAPIDTAKAYALSPAGMRAELDKLNAAAAAKKAKIDSDPDVIAARKLQAEAAAEVAATQKSIAEAKARAATSVTRVTATPKVTPKNIYDGMTAEQIVAAAEAAAAAAGTAASSAAAPASTAASLAAGADAATAATAATVTTNDADTAAIDSAVAAGQDAVDAAIEGAKKVGSDLTAFTTATDAENKRIDELVDKNTDKEFNEDDEDSDDEGADDVTTVVKTVGTFVDPETGDVYALKDDSTKTLISLGTKKSDANTAAQEAADAKAADAYQAQMLKDAQTQEIKEERESAYEVLKTEFMKYDFDDDFISQVKNLILTGTPVSEATLKLRATDEYAIRFAGNQERRNAGKNVYDEATYLTLENQYRETFGAYGLDNLLGDKKTTRAKLAQYIGQDKSPVEIKKRIQMAVEQVQNRLDVRLMFDSYYPDITDKDLISYFLEPKETLASLENKVNISSIGSTAMRQGLIADYEVAKELSEMGVSEEQAAAGYKNVAGVLPDAKRLTSIEGGKYTQSEAEGAYLKQTASEQRKLAKLAEREQARFASSSGVNKTSLTSSTMGQLY